MKTTIYTPESSLRSPRKMLAGMWGDLIRGRELAWRLAVRDISAMYRQSFLGILWAFIVPLAGTVTWIFLKGSGVIAISSTDIPYPVYVFAGTMLWSIFMDSLAMPLNQTNSAKAMLSKINFPRESLILSGIYQILFNSGIKVVLILAALIIMGVYPGWSLLLFPFAMLSLMLAGITVGMLLTPLGMLYTDIGKGIPLAMQFFMFVTPVVFPIPKSGWVAQVFYYNPVTPIMMTARNWLTDTPAGFLHSFLYVNAVLVVLLFLSWIVYRVTMPVLIERMSA
jgi:lipopolysaccharide transport system permease protein